MRVFEHGYEVVPKGFTDSDRRTMEDGEIGAFSWFSIFTGWRIGLPPRYAIMTKVGAWCWWLEWKLREKIKCIDYRLNRLRWKIREKIIIMGLTDGTAYYLSEMYGDDKNSGLGKAEAFATYDRAQGELDYCKNDIIVILDSTNYGIR